MRSSPKALSPAISRPGRTCCTKSTTSSWISSCGGSARCSPIGICRSEISIFQQERRFLSSTTFVSIERKRDEFEALVTQVVERGIESGACKPVATARVLAFAVIGVAR
ncbi:hypothetical protein ACFORO_38545 [Amycolatopsis halotolerans]|uniref:HTH-type transcriptional repressor KstR2 C-terminal domain-containing protein n=1 Tax=Amycolatopsis halotolerans TaxID=330083 RepID=A0ABV7QS33_9PSEU